MLYDAPNLTSGFDDAIAGTIHAVPIFTPMLLIFVFCVVALGGGIAQRYRNGFIDLPMWGVLASLCTLLVSLVLTLKAGLIDGTILGIVVAVTFAFGLWFFLSRRPSESM